MDPPQTQPRHHSWELTGRAPITSYSRAWVQVAGRCPRRPGMLHAQSTGRTPAHPAPVLYACCACWDIPLCTLTNHRPVLTPFSQSTSSPHHCMQLHANVHAHTCGHWTHASSPSAHQIPPNPRAPESQVPAAQSHTISSQGLHEVHSCSCTRMTRELTTEHPHQVPSAWHLVTGNSLPPEMAVRTVSCTRETGAVALTRRSGAWHTQADSGNSWQSRDLRC